MTTKTPPTPVTLLQRALYIAGNGLTDGQSIQLHSQPNLTISCRRNGIDIILEAAVGSQYIKSAPILQHHHTWQLTSTSVIIYAASFLEMVRQEMEDPDA